MPYRDPAKQRAYQRRWRRERRRRRAEARAAAKAANLAAIPDPPADPAAALAKWSRERLIVPPGHPASGRPMELPAFGVQFFDDALRSREALLCLARKNAKSAIVAAYCLARLVGPLRIEGWRGGCCSVSREKAGELLRQVEDIAEASGLEGLRFYRSPAPGRVESASGRFDILSADRSAGHASGFDDALIDELGLLGERHRELVNGMRSSVSARRGRFLALSVRGDAPFTAEMIERQAEPGVAVHLYTADPDCKLDDPRAWAAANPGLGTIKSREYMEHEARRALRTPADAAAFRAFDLNLAQSPTRVLICDPGQWSLCVVDDLPAREGPCVVGFDLGGSSSMTAAAAIWPATWRLETWGAFPSIPDLRARGADDGVGDRYERMLERGELQVYGGRVTPAAEFLTDVAARLAGERVIAVGADRYRKAEALQALEGAGVRWPMVWRGQGAHATADGSHDVRAFQRAVLARKVRSRESLLLASAIAESALEFDRRGNPALDKGRAKGRIDALSAAVIAAGLAELHGGRSRRGGWRYHGAA